MANTPIKVILFEDNDLLRESIAGMIALNPSLKLIGSYGNVLDVESIVKKLSPDLVFMDIDMPGITGIAAVKKIRTFDAQLPIIMLTVFDDNQHVLDAICAGASGYLLKKHISDKLFDSVNEVLSGGAPMSPSIARLVIKSMHPYHAENSYQLTPREREILTSLSRGNSTKLIALEHGITFETVRSHIKKIYEKLHVHSQTEAVSKALKEKII
ncbi:MAG TPA: DNA-binding response regulator [Cytophagales bacterium]|nr:DNA-binding response regulator [Cytophagales bacterium]